MKFTLLAFIAAVGAVQINDADYFFARQDGRKGYIRVPPTRFSHDSDDLFMRSMIMNYAAEEKDEDTGVPTGKFTLNQASAERACLEVVMTHMKKSRADAQAYMKTYFPRTWAHFDVNGSGMVEVERMP